MTNTYLETQIKRISDPCIDATARHAVRRVYLVDRETGLPCELEQNYIDVVLGTKAVGTQDKAGDELAVFRQWRLIQSLKDKGWKDSLQRALQSEPPMSSSEIDDFANSCSFETGFFSKTVEALKNRMPLDTYSPHETVSAACLNGRIRTAMRFLMHLLNHGRKPANVQDLHFYAYMSELKRSLETEMQNKLVPVPKHSEVLSLNSIEVQAMELLLDKHPLFTKSVSAQRDALIIRTLRETSFRAGELLKIKTEQVCEPSELLPSPYITTIRDPQSAEDCRKYEPAVKTRNGDVPISNELFKDLQNYILGPRRNAVELRTDGVETAYLFVNHEGNPEHIGKETSQRNINRVVKKLTVESAIRSTVHPHSLRHTGLTELADGAQERGRDGAEIEQLVTDMGRFTPGSPQVAHYTGRHVRTQTAKFKRMREDEIRGKKT
ncbi:MAG: site-specific integrase [Gammaproteobacteria bacterium]|nr:site-specific integrase [Gammaproteobacteria bacterium]MBU1443313.1 site-specific integrase [Gammaproteobacteria bacterium]